MDDQVSHQDHAQRRSAAATTAASREAIKECISTHESLWLAEFFKGIDRDQFEQETSCIWLDEGETICFERQGQTCLNEGSHVWLLTTEIWGRALKADLEAYREACVASWKRIITGQDTESSAHASGERATGSASSGRTYSG